MKTHFRICYVCVTVSGLWLTMSALSAWGFAPLAVLITPIALLMGGSVVGIAYQRSSLRWKITTIAIGMPVAYFLVTNISKKVVGIEIIILLVIAYILFSKKRGDHHSTVALEKQMKQCC